MKFKHIAELLITARRHSKRRYNQDSLAYALGYKNGQFISNIERGLCSIPDDKIVLLAKLLGIDPIDIKDAKLKDMDAIITGVIKDARMPVPLYTEYYNEHGKREMNQFETRCKYCGSGYEVEDDLAGHESTVHNSKLEDFRVVKGYWELK